MNLSIGTAGRRRSGSITHSRRAKPLLNQTRTWILYHPTEMLEELHSRRSIDDSMVKREAEWNSILGDDSVVIHDYSVSTNRAEPQNCCLGRIEDWCKRINSVLSQI